MVGAPAISQTRVTGLGRKQEKAEAVREGERRFIIPVQLPRSFLTVSRKNRKRSHIEEILLPRFRVRWETLPFLYTYTNNDLMDV